MADLGPKIEEIITEEDSIHLCTLQRAIQVSQNIIKITHSAEQALHDKNNNNDNKEVEGTIIKKGDFNVQQNELIKQEFLNNTSEEDFNKEIECRQIAQVFPTDTLLEVLRSSFIKRQFNDQLNCQLRQQITTLIGSHRNDLINNIRANQTRNNVARREWFEERHHIETNIAKLAHELSMKELQETERQLNVLHKEREHYIQFMSLQLASEYRIQIGVKCEIIDNLVKSLGKQTAYSFAELHEKLKIFDQLINKMRSGCSGPNELKMVEKICYSVLAQERNILKLLAQQQNNSKGSGVKLTEETPKQSDPSQANDADTLSLNSTEEQQQHYQQQHLPLGTEGGKLNFDSQNEGTVEETQSKELVTVNTTISTTSNSVQSTTTTTISAPQPLKTCINSQTIEFYMKINKFYQEKVENFKNLQQDESTKKYRLECQKFINTPMNAISAASEQHIRDKFDKLYTFVTSQRDVQGDYCLLLLAKKFVNQGETTVSSNPQAAFPLATVVVSLWKKIPEFGPLFLAYVFKESPFLVPYLIPQQPNQSFEEYAAVLGYRINNGTLEQQDIYLKRQAGIARMYAAVMITPGRKQDGPQHPYTLEHAWSWLVNIVQLTPLPDICATIIMEFLQLLSYDLWKTYGRQFTKLLKFIQKYYMPQLSQVDEGGPKARLELLVNKLIKEGRIDKPQGMLPADFW